MFVTKRETEKRERERGRESATVFKKVIKNIQENRKTDFSSVNERARERGEREERECECFRERERERGMCRFLS